MNFANAKACVGRYAWICQSSRKAGFRPPTCGPVLEAPCGGGAGLGRDRPRAVSDVRWRALGRARARGVTMAARGRGRVESRARGLRWCRRVRDPALGGLDAGRAGQEWRLSGANLNTGVLTTRAPWGTDSDGAIPTASSIGVLTARGEIPLFF